MKSVARCPAILIAGRMRARAGFRRDQARATPRETSGCRVTTGGITSRRVKGQRGDDPETEPANVHPPGLATTMRMAARPSSCLQRKPAAPFDLSAAFSICGSGRRTAALQRGSPALLALGPALRHGGPTSVMNNMGMKDDANGWVASQVTTCDANQAFQAQFFGQPPPQP